MLCLELGEVKLIWRVDKPRNRIAREREEASEVKKAMSDTETTPKEAEAKPYREQGQSLKQIRLSQQWSLAKLAVASGISVPMLSKIETGERNPSKELRAKLQTALPHTAVEQIKWPASYDPASYNHRQPANAPQDSEGDKLRQLRLEKGLTQDELARTLGLTYQAYGRLERGLSQNLKESARAELVRLLGPEAVELFR